jgi:apolipoprotein N-acyltransferase
MDRIPALAWCLLSSLLLWLAFYPMNLGWLAWLALIPLLGVLEKYATTYSPLSPSGGEAGGKGKSQSVTKGARKSRGLSQITHRPLLSAWLAGLAFCLLALQWIRIASSPMYATWMILALVVSLQWLFFFLFTRLLCQSLKLPLLLAAPITWTALEYLRSQIWIGFAWYYLGHTQHQETYFIQAADVAGVYGLSFLVMMLNVALWRLFSRRCLRVAILEFTPALALVALASWYGSQVLAQDAEQLASPRTPTIAILQGNQPQDLRNDPQAHRRLDETYSRLGEQAALHHPALMIAPETCLSFSWIRLRNEKLPPGADERTERIANYGRAWLYSRASEWNADLLFGFVTENPYQPERKLANSAVLFDRQGRERGCYDKIVCLPFGEYIPWADTLPFMKWLSPYDYEYTIKPGNLLSTLPWQSYRIAPLICYEDTVPDLTRAFMLKENPDFFVNLSNDGWFKGWEEHEQHLVCARFRCIETRRSMVRAVNMGISCIIDPLGRITALPPDSKTWHEAKDREAVILGTVPLSHQSSFYTQNSDLLPWLCWGIMILAFFLSFLPNLKRTPAHESQA